LDTIRYFDIAWLSKFDGPGTRLVVFLQGCNVKCKWCHSPHSWRKYSPVLLNKERCSLCGNCESVCENDVHRISNGIHTLHIENCVSCGKCIEACMDSSFSSKKGPLFLPTIELQVSKLFSLIYPQLKLLKKIGGITLSGGEALLQHKAARELLKLCKEEGIHTAVESSGFLPLENYKSVSEFVDYWLIGIRGVDKTSPKLSTLRENLEFITSINKEVLVRFPIICGYTDSEEQLKTTKELMKEFSLPEIHLLPYNENAPHYYNAMDLPFGLEGNPSPSEDQLETIRNYFKNSNINARL